jgi:hypothetical protein
MLMTKEPLINYARARRCLCGILRCAFGERGWVIPNERIKTGRSARKASALSARWFTVACLLLTLTMGSMPVQASKIQYKYKAWSGPELKIVVTRPVGLAADRPVVFVMHGDHGDADHFRERWHELAIKYDFLLVTPEISRAESPGSIRPHLGNLFDEYGEVRTDSSLFYPVIERVFDEVRSRFGLSTNTYSLYGHAEGAEFVQRFIFYMPTARVSRVVIADAGWYMMPDFNISFPYGLGQSAVDQARLERGLQLPVTLMLDEPDPEVDDNNLLWTPEAVAQGQDRVARGQVFFESAQKEADELGVPFNWRIETVEGSDNHSQRLAPASIPFLLGDDDSL